MKNSASSSLRVRPPRVRSSVVIPFSSWDFPPLEWRRVHLISSAVIYESRIWLNFGGLAVVGGEL